MAVPFAAGNQPKWKLSVTPNPPYDSAASYSESFKSRLEYLVGNPQSLSPDIYLLSSMRQEARVCVVAQFPEAGGDKMSGFRACSGTVRPITKQPKNVRNSVSIRNKGCTITPNSEWTA